jgi:NAD(P)-dependent dehydrogenase (short-subunit alcohol dehydrogenase family)
MIFTGKVVLVAGGTGGLGRAVTLAFLNAGADVVVTYIIEAELTDLKSLAGASASRLTGRMVDVTNEDTTRQLIDEIIADRSQLDALVNTVGGYAGGTKLWESDTKTLDRMLALNLRSGFSLSHAAARAMVKQGKGAIVNVAAKAALDHPGGLAAYSASKAAALAMIDSIIDTAANRRAMPDADFATWPKPEDIARVIVFLCSDDSRVIHGAAIPVYGN